MIGTLVRSRNEGGGPIWRVDVNGTTVYESSSPAQIGQWAQAEGITLRLPEAEELDEDAPEDAEPEPLDPVEAQEIVTAWWEDLVAEASDIVDSLEA